MMPFRNIRRNVSKALAEPGYGLRVLRKRAVAALYYRLGNGASPPPETISLFLTYQCNLGCAMCGQWGKAGSFKGLAPEEKGAFLEAEILNRLVDEVSSFKPNITLFGGEPLMHPGWVEVAGNVKKNGMRCNIVTNGTLMGEHAEALVRMGMDEVILSLDGVGETHDRSRGVKGTYEKIVSGFSGLRDAKEKLGMTRPVVRINCTLSGENYERLEEIIPAARALGAKSVTFHHLLFLGREAVLEHETFFRERFGRDSRDWWGFVRDELPGIRPDVLLEQMEKVRSRRGDIEVSFYPNFTGDEVREYYSSFVFKPRSYGTNCMSPWMVAYIFPDGTVKPYHTMNFSAGNIRESKFLDIWNAEPYKRFRRTVKGIGCFAVCTKGCTELYRY